MRKVFLEAKCVEEKIGKQSVAESAWDIPYLNRKIFLFHYQIFKSVINFSYFVIRYLLNSSIVKSDNKIGKNNDKKKI